ncbi:L-serine ammonia-lyase [Modestobacter italicus]|uniref:L-serine dehydratase n=1 Tax=Modestobacter italicus (strain DSM 44449 / CECT 9708 / BC 501) TaxID=2732864 RepID=I4EYN8_MODI5|nr:L-serine ammonia-lyase [Modestobacter marinus]CCH88501.1 L-serine ammonia-lyase [Modestobacter marinus]
MALSAFDLYSVGIGPSSSHTVGPMRAAKTFVDGLASAGRLPEVARVQAELFGSLGATGHGHGSAKAVVLGLEGEEPATVDTESSDARVAAVREQRSLLLAGKQPIAFDSDADLVLHRRRSLPAHPNGMVFRALDADGALIAERTYYSVGGGFVVDEAASGADRVVLDDTPLPLAFTTGGQLLEHCRREGMSISDVMLVNEQVWRSVAEIRAGMLHLWSVMQACVDRGCRREGVLPGGLKVPRRAPGLFQELSQGNVADPLHVIDWVDLYALAVNEENASGGRIVTAPTNGAAGIVPAVLHYYARFVPGADDDGIVRFLLTAAAIGILFKENASISGAEVGCQGEVGSACSMAAGALCEVLGGTPEQAENAAEVGIEHNLGLTCDPVGGLVQIPCIERNAIASVKAINAARLALSGNGSHKVSLDKAIKTMRETGADMKVKYKETSRGGLAVNVIEC